MEIACWTERVFHQHGSARRPTTPPVEKHFQERSAELQIPPLRYPGFPVDVGGVGRSHAPFLKRKAHTRLCPVLRGRKSGFASVGMTKGEASMESGCWTERGGPAGP